jgi:uncharacterized membrane protein (DUF106 family)
MVFFDSALEIAIISVGVFALSKLIQNRFTDKEKMMRHRAESEKKQVRVKELLKDHERNKEEIAKLQGEIMEHGMEIMSSSMKSMYISLPILLIIFFLLRMFYGDQYYHTPIPIIEFTNYLPSGLTFNPGFLELYFSLNLYTQILLSAGANIYKTVKGQAEKGERGG